jgi:hypothetical protein
MRLSSDLTQLTFSTSRARSASAAPPPSSASGAAERCSSSSWRSGASAVDGPLHRPHRPLEARAARRANRRRGRGRPAVLRTAQLTDLSMLVRLTREESCPPTVWRLKGKGYEFGNRQPGMLVQGLRFFPPHDSSCRAAVVNRIDEGHCGDVDRSRVTAPTTTDWPKASTTGQASSSTTSARPSGPRAPSPPRRCRPRLNAFSERAARTEPRRSRCRRGAQPSRRAVPTLRAPQPPPVRLGVGRLSGR